MLNIYLHLAQRLRINGAASTPPICLHGVDKYNIDYTRYNLEVFHSVVHITTPKDQYTTVRYSNILFK
jgi:hypothetical protein